MNPRPVHPVDERHQLRRTQPDDPIFKPGPAKTVFIQTLGEQANSTAIPPDNLDPVLAFRPEHIKRAREWIGAGIAHQRQQSLRPFAEVDRLRRHQYPRPRRDHADRATRITSAKRTSDAAAPTRIVTSLTINS